MTGRVAIVGNGPVGQTLALLLARWGVPSVVLDGRTRRDAIGSKAICQQRDVVDVWDAIGVGARIAEEGVTWSTARTFHRDRELFSVRFADLGSSPFPPFANLSQSRTEALLDERLAVTDAADVRWGHTVEAIGQDGRGVTLRCRTDAGPTEVRAEFAVLCAGSRADALRHQLGLELSGRSFDDAFLICDIRADLGAWRNERRFHFDPEWNPGRQVLIHPCPDSVFRIDWQVPPGFDADREASTGGLDRMIRQIIGTADYEVVWRSLYRFHSRLVDRMRVGRVLVAGDCAHLVSPFGARGLNSGVQDAENAAWKLAFVLRGWAPEALLESYHDERHAAAEENLAVTGRTMDFLVPQDELARQRRLSILEEAATSDAARAEVDSGRLAEPFWYVQSPLTTPDPARPFAGRPPAGRTPAAGPGVLLPDLHLAPADGGGRARQAAREGLLVLCGEAVCPETPEPRLAEAPPMRVARPDDAGMRALGIAPHERWVVRPDAHVAGIAQAADTVERVIARALGGRSRSG